MPVVISDETSALPGGKALVLTTVAMNHLPEDPIATKALAALHDQGLAVISAPGSVADSGVAQAIWTP